MQNSQNIFALVCGLVISLLGGIVFWFALAGWQLLLVGLGLTTMAVLAMQAPWFERLKNSVSSEKDADSDAGFTNFVGEAGQGH